MNKRNDKTVRRQRIKGSIAMYESKNKQFYAHVKSSNGRILFTSETYKTMYGCRKGVYAMLEIVFDPRTQFTWPKTKKELAREEGKNGQR